MNLWVKRIGLGLMTALALFLFACLEEENILGFKNQDQKFTVSYIEIPVESSVILFDPLRTSNYFNDPIRRLLVGSYTDPSFGTAQAEAYTQIRPSAPTKIKETGAIYDSVTLYLHLDLYQYGDLFNSTLNLSVHSLIENMTFRGDNDYYASTQVAYDPTPLGTGSEVIKPQLFKDELADFSADTIITVDVKLDAAFGQSLFDAWNHESTSFTDQEKFNKIFKGLAIIPTSANHIVGLSLSDSTRITLHYHTPGTDGDTLRYNFYMSNIASSSRIVTDRTGTALEGLTTYTEFIPSNPDKRFIQSGVPIGVKLDISKFLEFADANEGLSLNSAELSISSIDEPGSYTPPNSLFVQLLNSENRLKKFKQTTQDSVDLKLYSNNARPLTNGLQGLSTFSISGDSIFTLLNDTQQEFAQLRYNSTDKNYKSFITLFMQELAEIETDEDSGLTKTRFTDLVLYPGNPFASKSVNRLTFDKNNIKLKIYYTIPIK